MPDILIIAPFVGYEKFNSSYMHQQAKAFATRGDKVRSLVMTPYGKKHNGRAFEQPVVFEEIDGVEVAFLRFISLSNFGNFGFNQFSARTAIKLFSRKLFADFLPEVIIANTIKMSNEGSILKKAFECPLVLICHGSDVEVPYQEGEFDYIRKCCDSADLITTVSSKLQRRIETCGTKTKVQTIVNGFAAENTEGLSFDKAPYSWIQVGNLIKQKNFDVTIRAFAAYKERFPQAYLSVVGQGPERNSLEKLCVELGITDSVSFRGQLQNNEVMKLLSKSQFFVMPSSPEGFGIAYLEAMACKCLTIGTLGEGISDVIKDGENGFLVKADDVDKITKIADYYTTHTDIAETICNNSKRTADELSWGENAKQYSAVISKLLSGW